MEEILSAKGLWMTFIGSFNGVRLARAGLDDTRRGSRWCNLGLVVLMQAALWRAVLCNNVRCLVSIKTQ